MTISPETITLEDAVSAYVAEGSGIDPRLVIPGKKTKPVPKQAYATVLNINSDPDGMNWTRENEAENGNIAATVYQSLTEVYSVQFFRTGAITNGRRFLHWVTSPNGILGAAKRGLTFKAISDLRRLDQIISQVDEERTACDLTLGVIVQSTQEIGCIDAAEIQVCLDNQPEATISLAGLS